MTNSGEKLYTTGFEKLIKEKCSGCGEMKVILPLTGGRCLSCSNEWISD